MNDGVMGPGRYWTEGSRLGLLVPTTGQPPPGGPAKMKDCHALDRLLLRREGLARKHQVSRPGAGAAHAAPRGVDLLVAGGDPLRCP